MNTSARPVALVTIAGRHAAPLRGALREGRERCRLPDGDSTRALPVLRGESGLVRTLQMPRSMSRLPAPTSASPDAKVRG